MKKSIDYSTKVLEVSNLKQYFNVGVGKNKLKVKAVDDISFDIYKKEVFGLVGESGCGKTTTGRTIIRLYKPTNGIVKLEGKIIGAGVNDLYKDMKHKTLAYKKELLALDKYKSNIYAINKKYNDLIANLKEEKNLLDKEYSEKIKEVDKPRSDYKNFMLDKKNEHEKKLSSLLFNFNIEKEKIEALTKNKFLVEQNGILKALKISHMKKLEGLRESAALSKENIATQKEELIKSYEEKIEYLKVEYAPKIEEYQVNIISKKDCKDKIFELTSKYNNEKDLLIQNYNNFLKERSSLISDFSEIDLKIESLKEELNKNKEEINNKIAKLKTTRDTEKKYLVNDEKIDQEKYDKLVTQYKNYINVQKQEIKRVRSLNKNKEIVDHIRNLQMIFQDPISSLNPRMTVLEIVSEGLVIKGEKDKNLIKEKVLEALDLVGLAPEYINRYPHEFSGGQRQRIGIARALIMNPSVIIADEPISALDVSIKAQVINLLIELREKLDLSILFIAHDLSVVKYFCDRIAVMYRGKIVELATSEELFENPLHGYTKALLSAIPHPDPDYEKIRMRTSYNPNMRDYLTDKPELLEIKKGHFVYANKKEVEEMKKQIGDKNEK